MKPWIAKRIKAANIGMLLEDDYSGRGMFGETTHAITTTFPVFAWAVALAARDIPAEDFDEFLDALRSVRAESMGRGVVFY